MQKYIYTIGRRKNAVATFRLYPGKGECTVNGKKFEEYFKEAHRRFMALEPLTLLHLADKYYFTVKIKGGGLSAQAGALRLALSRALAKENVEYKNTLKKAGMLTRDDREKERKKTGLVKARKAPQFSKR